jgi:endonuclease YncB( thermonuclease family)
MSFTAALCAVLLVGAGGGIGMHYAVETGIAGTVIDRMTTAAVDVVKPETKEFAPVQIASREPLPKRTARRFEICASGHRVTCVVDGDTVWIDGTKIRLSDIDAPEVFSPKCRSEKALGDRATRRLLQLVNAGPFEIRHLGNRDHDRYGRDLRVLVRGGRSLGDILVSEGLVRTWSGRREPWC